MGDSNEGQRFTIHGSVFRDKPGNAQASLSTGAGGCGLSSAEARRVSASVGSLVATVPEVLADLSGAIEDKVRRELPAPDLVRRIWRSVRDLRDMHGVSEEAMANILPETTPQRGADDREGGEETKCLAKARQWSQSGERLVDSARVTPASVFVAAGRRFLGVEEFLAARCPCWGAAEADRRHARLYRRSRAQMNQHQPLVHALSRTLKIMPIRHQAESGAPLHANRDLCMDIVIETGGRRDATASEYRNTAILLDVTVVPLSTQRSFRDGCFQVVADVGVMFTAGLAAVMRPRLAARFLAIGRQREDHRYGAHPRQVIEVVRPAEGVGDGRPKVIVFVHGGAWGSGRTWMYRVMVDRLSQLGYTVVSLSYRVYPDADIHGQVDDLAAAMRWMSCNTRVLGLDELPEVYLMGHSSGAHVSLLYLIRRAEDDELREKSVGMTNTGDGAAGDSPAAVENAVRVAYAGGSATGDNPPALDDNAGGRELEVEGFIGLSGVYDVHSHYLYESWRGVHEISPMKAANGGVLHVLLDHSHPRLLGGKPSQKSIPSSRPAAKQSPPDLRRRLSVPKQSSENGPAESDGAPHVTTGVRRPLSVTTSAGTNPPELGVAPREFPGSAESYQVESGNTPNNSLGNNSLGGGDGVGLVGSRGSRAGEGLVGSLGGGNGGPLPGVGGRRLGRRLPRCLVVHGMADATVPFVQTATVGAALKALGVPTIVRFEPGGDHVGMVGQLMFSKNSTVESALLRFTSPAAAEDARIEREQPPSPIHFPHIPSRL
eukprot:jgi/Undpi1/3049/HiC_scaffold_15.g06425.m1